MQKRAIINIFTVTIYMLVNSYKDQSITVIQVHYEFYQININYRWYLVIFNREYSRAFIRVTGWRKWR